MSMSNWVPEDVVENGAALGLPEVEADGADLLVLASLLDLVGVVLGAGDHGVHPLALEVGVVDHEKARCHVRPPSGVHF